MRLIIGILFLVLSFSCTKEGSTFLEEPSPNSDLLNMTYGVKLATIWAFKSVALGTEYGSGFEVTQKWTSSMNIFIGGTPTDELLTELNLIKDEINSLTTDGFSMNIVNDSLQSNFYLFFGSPSGYTHLFPEQFRYIQNNQNGLFHMDMNNNFEIISGHMYVNTDITNSLTKRHILREELTQSLGIPNDDPYDRSSIFYYGISNVTSYNNVDIRIIRLLYHPNMRSGLDSNMTDFTLKGILGIS